MLRAREPLPDIFSDGCCNRGAGAGRRGVTGLDRRLLLSCPFQGGNHCSAIGQGAVRRAIIVRRTQLLFDAVAVQHHLGDPAAGASQRLTIAKRDAAAPAAHPGPIGVLARRQTAPLRRRVDFRAGHLSHTSSHTVICGSSYKCETMAAQQIDLSDVISVTLISNCPSPRLHTAGVAGSIPAAPTIYINDLALFRDAALWFIESRSLPFRLMCAKSVQGVHAAHGRHSRPLPTCFRGMTGSRFCVSET